MTLTSSATVNAKAFMSGYDPSTEASASFTNTSTNTVTGNTYYVATNGSDSNTCNAARNINTPKRNIMGASGGISCLSAGDTLDLRSGTYNENIISYGTPSIPNGAAGSYVTIRGHAGETVSIPTIGFSLNAGRQYINFDNLIIDVSLAGVGNSYDGLYIGGSNNHIWLTNSEIRNAGSHGVHMAPGSSFNAVVNVNIHDSGQKGVAHEGYGMYIEGNDNLFDSLHVHQNPGYGIHIYQSGGSVTSNNIVRNSEINNNGGSESSQFGIIISSGAGNTVNNSSIYNNTAGVQVDYGCANCVVSGNTIYGNNAQGYAAILIGSSPIGTVVAGNTIFQSIGTITDNGTGTIISNNTIN